MYITHFYSFLNPQTYTHTIHYTHALTKRQYEAMFGESALGRGNLIQEYVCDSFKFQSTSGTPRLSPNGSSAMNH